MLIARKNSEALEEILKFSGELVNRRATQQSTVVTAKTTTAKSEKVLQDTIGNIEAPADAYENSNESNTIAKKDIATSIEKLDNAGDQLICEKNETAVTETDIQEPNVPDSLSSIACFDNEGNSVDEKSSKKAIQPIVVGVVGAALLVSSIVAYLLKMYAIAVIGGIVGLACISFALYNALKPNTKLEKVESVEQPTLRPSVCSETISIK
ncbi:hypothetical protein [Wolbachia endosymbiont (group A) of Anomoia purmunda]|uniref:hypothetical protein n=1 Tax=Wolbachia endosymbiont (group A) of Anomoia purmunda TaxID=2953978 RepID=UPI0022319A66|nr:hypothetical protein [Wolbachia endosymbiont (group A) of Anomoia purmunda]